MFRFRTDIVVEGVPHKAGDVVPAGDLPAGSLESLLRMRQVEQYTPPPVSAPEPAAVVEPTEVIPPKPAAKKASKKDAAAPSPDGQQPQ